MPRPSRPTGLSRLLGFVKWELPDPAAGLRGHAIHDTTRLEHLAFYVDFAIPLATPVYQVYYGFDVQDHLYTYQATGTAAESTSPPEAPCVLLDHVPQAPCAVLLAWRRRVYAEERTCYLEVRWHPARGRTQSMSWPQGMSLTAADHHRRTALTLLKAEEQRGRPPDIEDKATFWDLYWKAYQKVLAHKRRESTTLPSKTEVASEMLLTVKTLRRYRDRYTLSWPPLPPP